MPEYLEDEAPDQEDVTPFNVEDVIASQEQRAAIREEAIRAQQNAMGLATLTFQGGTFFGSSASSYQTRVYSPTTGTVALGVGSYIDGSVITSQPTATTYTTASGNTYTVDRVNLGFSQATEPVKSPLEILIEKQEALQKELDKFLYKACQRQISIP